MSNLKLVIFDCDGVLFDSKNANRVYYNLVLEKFGHPPMSEEELEYVHMHHAMDSTRYIFRNYPEDLDTVNQFRAGLDYRQFLKYMIMEPDLMDFLKLLKKNGLHTAISTNRTTTMPDVLSIFGLAPYFDKVVTALDVENPKPHPEALQKILDHFNLSVEDALYIGDSQVDLEHSANIGMTMIAFKNPDLPVEYHVQSFMEIPRLPVADNLFIN